MNVSVRGRDLGMAEDLFQEEGIVPHFLCLVSGIAGSSGFRGGDIGAKAVALDSGIVGAIHVAIGDRDDEVFRDVHSAAHVLGVSAMHEDPNFVFCNPASQPRFQPTRIWMVEEESVNEVQYPGKIPLTDYQPKDIVVS